MEVYRNGNWYVMQHVLTNGSKTYAIADFLERRDPLEAVDLPAAIKIANCLATNAA